MYSLNRELHVLSSYFCYLGRFKSLGKIHKVCELQLKSLQNCGITPGTILS